MRDPQKKITRRFNTEVRRTAHEIDISKRGSEITQKAKEHFEKYRSQWVNQRYGRLINSKAAPAPELTPNGLKMSPSQKASKAAKLEVEAKQKSRLDNIKAKVERMVDRSKGNDPTRPRGRDKDLTL
ncbi:MAG: hypothetical protein LCH83_13770 [Proteobacteria bacterium]|nr:hypothetical protein [Pseudomonadota bacterium]